MQNCVSLTSAFERSYDLSLLTPMCQWERSPDITITTSKTDPCLHTLSFTRRTKTAALVKRKVRARTSYPYHEVIRNALWKNQTHKALLPFSLWARSIQPNFPEISVQNSMDRFGPTGKVSKKRGHLLRWTTFPGRTGWNFG